MGDMKLRILLIKHPVEHIHGEILTEKIEFPIEWAGQSCGTLFQAYSSEGRRFAVWPSGSVTLDGRKLEFVKAWEIVP